VLHGSAGETHEISGISVQGAVSEATAPGRPRSTQSRLMEPAHLSPIAIGVCPSLECRLEWLISCVSPGSPRSRQVGVGTRALHTSTPR
jgi:hypothetical protein